jgi:hypothetical protein
VLTGMGCGARVIRWYENILLLEELPCPAVVALAAGDEVAPVHAIRDYLAPDAHRKLLPSAQPVRPPG